MKGLFSTLIGIVVVIAIVAGFTYGFFSVDTTVNELLNVSAIFTGDLEPVFLARSDGPLVIEVPSDNVATGVSKINIELTGAISSDNDEKVNTTCSFDLIYEENNKGYDKYVPSFGVSLNNLKEYTLKIESNGKEVYAEKQISELADGETLAKNLKITSDGSLTTRVYDITASVYKLNLEQTIFNKKYSFNIKVGNVDCQVDDEE